jgi:hypothetical protein
VDESVTGSANLWSGPRKRAGRFSGACLDERLAPRIPPGTLIAWRSLSEEERRRILRERGAEARRQLENEIVAAELARRAQEEAERRASS